MPTTFGTLKTTGALTVVGLATFGAVTLTSTLTGTDATFTGDSTLGNAATDTVTVTGDLKMTGSGVIKAASGSSATLTLMGAGGGVGSGSYFCIGNPADDTLEVCAFSGGTIDCNDFGHITCPSF